jgi:hypothetical protein
MSLSIKEARLLPLRLQAALRSALTTPSREAGLLAARSRNLPIMLGSVGVSFSTIPSFHSLILFSALPSFSMDIVLSRHLTPLIRLSLLLLATGLLGLPGGQVLAADNAPTGTVELGIGGKLKVGSWTPVSVKLSEPLPQRADVVAITTDFENNRLETPLVAKSPTELAGLVQVGRLEGRVTVNLRQEGKDSVIQELLVAPEGTASPASYRQSTEFWGVLGSSARFEDAANEWTERIRRSRGQSAPARAIAMKLDWSLLPDAVEAWDSLDVLVIGGDAYTLPPEKNETLRRWVERGGRVLFLLGSETEAYRKSLVAGWSPIFVEGSVAVTSLDMVAKRVDNGALLRLGLRRSIPAALLPGEPEGTLPGAVVFAKPYGFGFVSAFAFDFEQPPLSTWQSQTELLRKLTMPAVSGPRANQNSDLTSTGITDLASQMASGLDRFEGVSRTSFRGVMLWTALWMFVLFPLDYLVVHKVLKRPHLTWLTLPFLIAGATLLASRSATASNAAPLTINQIDLVDFTPADSIVRVQSWMSFYSGETARYDLKATSAIAGDASLAWNAKPEEGLRGLYRQGGLNFGSPAFRTSADHTRIEELPVRLWSSYSLSAEASRELKGQAPLFQSSLSESDAGRLQGEIRHHLPGPLQNWMILYKNFLYYPAPARGELTIGEWKADQDWRPAFDGKSLLVKVYLQGGRQILTKGQGNDAKMDQVRTEVMPYDSVEFDPGRLLPMLSFHDLAGGPGYTGLSNAPLGKLDLSRTLDSKTYKGTDCAVVMGRLEIPAMSYEINGQVVQPASCWTFVRSVLPVKAP